MSSRAVPYIVSVVMRKLISSLFNMKPESGRSMGVGATLRGLPQRRGACQHENCGINCGIVSESSFMRMLRVERKRTERSRQPFLLLLLNINNIAGSDGKHDLLTVDVLAALTSCTRETDIIGWYRNSSVMGVICTVVGTCGDVDKSVRSIVSKVSHSLHEHLGQERSNKVGVSCHVFPDGWPNKELDNRMDPHLYPDIAAHQKSKWLHSTGKRTIDTLASGLALIVLSPIFLLIALLIKTTSKGPIIFRQERVGLFGRHFTFLKFRSMYTGGNTQVHEQYVKRLIAGTGGLPQHGVYKIQNDLRITAAGRFLRKTSLDELPQFWNVLTGDMSLVGPRPPVLYEVESYDIWHRYRCLEAKPGITGLWQVTGRSRVCFDDMVRLDLQYARLCSFWLDVKILLRTPRAVLIGEGAY